MTMPETPLRNEAPLFSRVGPIRQVTVRRHDVETAPLVAGGENMVLLTTFFSAADWHLTHTSLTSHESVRWN